MSSSDHYELLEVSRTASTEAIVAAYRRLSRKFHPDVNPAPDAARRFAEITEAYEVLSDPERRQRYDLTGETYHPPADGATGASAGDAAAMRAVALRQARNGALWVAGGGALTAATYFGGTSSFWIAWGAVLFGGVQSLRGLASYFSLSGRWSTGLAVVLGLLLVGVGSAGAVAESEREAAILVAAGDRAAALRDEAVRHTDAVFARTDPWGVADVRDMLRAADLYAAAAHELDWNMPVLAVAKPKDYRRVTELGRLYRDRSELSRRIAFSTTDSQRTTLFEEWDRQVAALKALLADMGGKPGTTAASSSTSTPTPNVTSTATAKPTVMPTPALRPVTLRSEQVIMPAVEFPLAGYDIGSDVSDGAGGWLRTFVPAGSIARYHQVRIWVAVLKASESGAALVAAETECAFKDDAGRVLTPRALRAEAVGEGAKACVFRSPPNVSVFTYLTGARNVAVQVMLNPRVEVTEAEAMRDSVRLASVQLAIIDRVAPR